MKTYVAILREHYIWRNQILKFAKSDMIRTNSGSVLGWAWTLAKPTINILVFWFVFSIGLRFGGSMAGYPFILWLIAGYIPWQYMSNMFTGGAGSIRKYRYLVTKMKFPVSTIPTFFGLSKITEHITLMVFVVIVFALSGHPPDIYLLQLPIYMLLMMLFFISWALFAGMLSAISTDFLNLIKSLTRALFWLSGILWDVGMLDSYGNLGWLKTILMFNPVTVFATGYRNVFINKVWIWSDPKAMICYAPVFLIMVALSVIMYKKLRKEIPDVL